VGDLNHDGCKDVAMADYNYGLIVMQGKNCWSVRYDSRPLVPPSTKTATVAASLASEHQKRSQVPSGRTVSAVIGNLARAARAASNSWLGRKTPPGRVAMATLVGFALFGGLWWFLRIWFRKS
jgi:hypothetical protein